MTDDLKARLRQAALLLPIRRNDTADYAEVFGQDFQAMTMAPNRFEALSVLPDAIARIEALEAALNLAANRLARCALDHGIGTQEFLEVSEWGEEARAALVGGGG